MLLMAETTVPGGLMFDYKAFKNEDWFNLTRLPSNFLIKQC